MASLHKNNTIFHHDPLMPIIKEDTMMMTRERIISRVTLGDTPFHSFRNTPQTVANTMVNAMRMPHEVKVKGPILLFPIP